jgi:hypothetical protein
MGGGELMAFVLSSLSGNLISAASAGFAPTNSADVSAIASAYAESAASSKQDTLTFAYDADKISAINGSALAGQGGGGLVTAIGTSNSGITSLNNSGLVDTAALHSADYSSLYVQEPLYISASGDSSYIGISGDIGGIDSATCSAIASAYTESAASSKQDASAMSSYALSADVSGVIDTVSSNSASWAGGITGDYLTAKVGSGQATLSTALQDGMDKRPALVISAQRNAGSSMYPRLLVTDWNNTTGETHSGALLANAFEFYSCPDSARGEVDPSGLVQSRLDASHLRFNVDPAISAYTKSSEYTRYGMRLGSAGNSASWAMVSGDGPNGGFIILNDGSGTSGRVYASSIPYWNDKLDGSAFSSFYTTANESGYVDSAYVESQVSSKQDTLTFDWDADSAISSINGSALAGQGGGGTQVQSDWTESSTAEPSYIQNKPAVFGILAGAGVKITESASAITIATEIPTYNTTTDVGKVLQVTVSGLAWVSLSEGRMDSEIGD